MASHLGLAIIVMIFAILIESNEEAGPNRGKVVKCDSNRNQYYHKQMRRCKKCDKCPEGYGTIEERTFEINPVHGAMGCYKCKPCIVGETYRRKPSYRQCKVCRNCTTHNRSEERACTTTRNAKCGLKSKPIFMLNTDQKRTDKIENGGEKIQKDVDMEHLKGLFGLGAFIGVIPIVVVAVCFRKRFRRKLTRPREDHGLPMQIINQPYTDSAASPQTVSSVEHDNTETNDQNGLEIHEAATNDLAEDANLISSVPKADAIPKALEDIPTDKECMLIAKVWANDNLHRSYAPFLGICLSEVERFEAENMGNEVDLAYRILDTWRRKQGRSATKSALRKVMEELQNPPDLETLLKS